ncbi:hypothetical protein LJB93_01100 [Desulfovibrio sp. OttesenSCG-928-F07]|nr:hypothetical protein [Desulfovibrio sp. OttesenSCG-928-F07]
MSDNFKVYGQGSGNARYNNPRKENLEHFKKGRKPGEVVKGVFVRLDFPVPGTAWVNFEGALLLSSLPAGLADIAKRIAQGQGVGALPTGVREGDFPLKSGDTCFFVLETLEPEPVLRMLQLDYASGQKTDEEVQAAILQEQQLAKWHNVLKLPPTQIAAFYSQKRSLLDTLLHTALWSSQDLNLPFPQELPAALLDFENPVPTTGTESTTANTGAQTTEQNPEAAKQLNNNSTNPLPPHTTANAIAEQLNTTTWRELRNKYSAFIANNEDAKTVLNDLDFYRAALTELLRPYGVTGLFFVPWLCPQAKGLELLFYSPAKTPLHTKNTTTAASSSSPNSAIDGIMYKLQGSMPHNNNTPEAKPVIMELAGTAGNLHALRRTLGNAEPDIVRFMLSLKPQAGQGGFSLKA